MVEKVDSQSLVAVLRCGELGHQWLGTLLELLGRYGLRVERVPSEAKIPGSYWGDSVRRWAGRRRLDGRVGLRPPRTDAVFAGHVQGQMRVASAWAELGGRMNPLGRAPVDGF